MLRSSGFVVLAIGVICLARGARAEDPPPVEILPAPQKVVPQAPVWVFVAPPPLPYQRINRYDVWQYYGVDRQNRWRPRVAYTPYGAFYLYNGQPYPYVATHPLEWMPYTSD